MHITIHTSQTWADTFISELNDTHVEAELRTKHIPPQVPPACHYKLCWHRAVPALPGPQLGGCRALRLALLAAKAIKQRCECPYSIPCLALDFGDNLNLDLNLTRHAGFDVPRGGRSWTARRCCARTAARGGACWCWATTRR